MQILLEAIDEDLPGDKCRLAFVRLWSGYRHWFLDGIRGGGTTYLQSIVALRRHMPELLPVFERFCEVTGSGDLEARFLSMWCPPAYVRGCSQVVFNDGDNINLIRNYDYSPHLLEGRLVASRLLGKRVIAMSDCVWGVLDGINEDGLAISLSFGGGRKVGLGFGIPLVLRYLLETTEDVPSAVSALSRLPVHMDYTLVMADRSGRHEVIYVGPGRAAERVETRVATNHQHRPTWHSHAVATQSVERESALHTALAASLDAEKMLSVFLAPPVYQQSYSEGHGTLYTCVYRPQDASVELVWPDHRWRQSCANFREGRRLLTFPETSGVARVRNEVCA